MASIPRSVAAVLVHALTLGASMAVASTNFGVPADVSSRASAASDADYAPEIATDGNGIWIAVWPTSDPALGVPAEQFAVAFSRTIDDGATWSTPQILRPELTAGHPWSSVSIAADGDGNWVVAYARAEWQVESIVRVIRSTDDGATWEAPVTLVSSTEWHGQPRVLSDGAGTWLVVWESDDIAYSTQPTWLGVLSSRSTDGGQTWGAPVRLSNDSRCFQSCYPSLDPRLATDSAGTWIVVWEASNSLWFTRSTDNGASWATPTGIFPAYQAAYSTADIATDGAGRWVLVWVRDDSYGTSLRIRRSTDNGLTFADVEGWPYFPAVELGTPRILSRGLGQWQILGVSNDSLDASIGGDADILTIVSRDDGVSWSSFAALVNQARTDAATIDYDPAVAISPSRKTMVAWRFRNDATAGIKIAAASQECPSIAREDCREPVEAAGSRLAISDSSTSSDRLSWTWRRGQETTDAALGNPTVSDDYALCLYEKSGGSPGLIGEWDAPAGATCSGKPCWTKGTNKLLYRDQELTQGSMRRIKMKGGVDGKASIRLFVTGPALAPPLLPLDVASPVRLQLVNLGTNACWEGIHGQADTNDELRFDSKSE